MQGYTEALDSCPRYLSYERAVIKSNIAACYLHTSSWKEAVKASTDALDLLKPKLQERKTVGPDGKEVIVEEEVEDDDDDDDDEFKDALEEKAEEEEEADEEIVSAGAQKAEPVVPTLSVKDKKKQDRDRIYTKALLRRAKARTELGGWSALQGAEEGRSSPS